jgi:hypothetical protein
MLPIFPGLSVTRWRVRQRWARGLSEQVSRLVRGELYLAQVEMPARIFWVPGVASRAAGAAPAASERTCAEMLGCARLLLWRQVRRLSLGCCLARLSMRRARTSPMAGSLLTGSGSGRCACIW